MRSKAWVCGKFIAGFEGSNPKGAMMSVSCECCVLSDVYPIKFCLKQKDVSALFRFKCALVYTIREVPANEKNLKLNETLEILFCVNDTNLLGENKYSFCGGYERGASIEVSLVANAEIKVGKIHNTEVGKQVSEVV